MSGNQQLGDTRFSVKTGIDAEELGGQRYPYQEDITLLDDVDLDASTPGKDLNWLEGRHTPDRRRHAGGVRSLLEQLPQDLLRHPARTARTSSRARS